MSTVDNRIVRMQFDNAQFEAGVMHSMNTLDKLNEKLQFKEATKGLSALMVAVDGVSSKSISTAVNALDRISSYTTSVLGMIAQKIKTQFADKIVDAIEAIPAKAMSQIKSGGWNRAMNIANAKFQIEGLKYSWDAVREAADYAVTDTAYGLDSAAKAASQLAASGVDFEKVIGKDGAGKDVTQMHKSLRAISGVAAMTNASYDDIAHTFTRIAGQGRVMGEDLNSLASRGLNAAATLAKSLNVTESEVRDMVSKGAIDFQMFSEAMDEAYGDHAKEANKTFTGSLSNMKAALSRIGAIFTQPVIDKTNTFFVAVTDRIKEFQKALSDTKGYKLSQKGIETITRKANEAAKARKDLTTNSARESFVEHEVKRLKELALGKELTESLNTGDVESFPIIRFAGHFAEAWESGVKAASTVVKSLDLHWFTNIADFLDKIAIKAKSFFDGITTFFNETGTKIESAADKVTALTDITFADFKIIDRVMKGELGTMQKRWAAIDDIMGKEGEGLRIQGYIDQLAALEYSYKDAGWTEDWIKQKEKESAAAAEEHAEGIAALVAERKKAAYEATREKTAEEIFYNNLATTLTTTKRMIQDLKDSFVNVGTIVKDMGTKVLRVGYYLNHFTNSFSPITIADGVKQVSEAVKNLVTSVDISQETLEKIGSASSKVGGFLTELVHKIVETTVEIIDFVRACLTAEESLEELAERGDLTPLQITVISVLRVVKNLWRSVTNIARAIVSVIKPIIKAFKNVFDPSGIASGVADFSEGLANFTEKLILSEEAASVLETVFGGLFTAVQGVATIITKVVGSITKFISSIGKAKTPTNQVADTLEKVEETGEKTTSVFDNLKKVFENIGKKIKELPTKFQELKDAVDQQEGVIRLKESFDKLKTSIKESLEKIKPFEKDVKEVGEAAGGTGETAIGTLASGIGIVAGKLADFIDKLPGWGTKIENFWNDLKTTVETWISTIHLDKFFDNLGDGVTEFFESDDSIIGKIRTFADKVFDGITGALEDVDWGKVGKGGILTLVAMNLFNFFRIGSGIETSIRGFASIPKNIGKIFTELGSVFTTANKSLKKITNAYIFSSIISSLMLMVSAVIILGQMDQNELKQGIAAVVWLAVGMAIIGKAVGAILGNGDRYYNKQNIKEIDKSQKNLLQINNSLGGLIGAGILLAGLGVAVWLVSKALINLGNEMKTNADGMKAAVWQLIVIMGIIGTAFLAIGIISAGVSKITNEGKNSLGNLFGAGILLAGIGAAVWLIVQAFLAIAKEMEGIDGKDLAYAAATVGVIMLLLTGFVAAAGFATKNTDWKSLGMLTVMMVVAVGMIAVIATEVMLLAKAMGHAQVEGHGDTIMAAMGVIAAIMLSLGTMIFMMGKGLEDLDHGGGALIGAVLTSAVLVLAIAFALKLIVDSVKDVDTDKLKWAIGGIVAIVLILGIAVTAMFALASSIFYSDQIINILVSIGFVFVMVGAMLLLVAEAISMIDQVSAPAVIAVGAMLLVIFAAVGLIINKIAKQPEAGGNVQKALLGVAVAFLAIAGAALMIAGAIKLLSGVTMNIGLAVTLGAIVAALLAFTYIGYKIAQANLGKSFMEFGAGIALMGAAFLLAGAGIWVAAKGLELIVSMAGGIATTIITVAEAIKEHWVIFLGLLGGLALLTWLVTSIIKNIGPIATVIADAVGSIVRIISTAIESISGHLKKGGKNFSKWWSDLQPKLKIGIVTGIATLCAAILKASPEMLKTIKELIKKVIFFIVDIIPTVVDGLFEIILRLLNSLADTIRKNSAKVAYAFWNIIESLIEVLVDVLVEGLLLLAKPIHGVLSFFGVDGKFEDLTDSLKASANGIKSSMRQGLSAAKDYADSSEDITQKMSGLDAAMNKVEKDVAKEAIHYENTAAGLAKYRGELAATTKAEDKATDSKSDLIAKVKAMAPGLDGVDLSKFDTSQLQSFLNGNTIPGMDFGVDAAGANANMPDVSTFMEDQGYSEENISIEGFDGGDSYIGGYNDALTDRDNLQETADSTQAIVDTTTNTINSPQNYQAVKQATHEGIFNPYNRVMVGNNATYWDNGYNVVTRTVDGMGKAAEDNKERIEKIGAATGNLVWRGANSKDGIDANSPSKKFYKSGLWCVLGLQQAIKDNSYLATGQAENLGNSMVDAIGSPLDYVSKIASGDIEYDPRIRPVMDLSGVGRTATDVSSMFANQNVTLSGMTGQIAYDMTTLNGSNAAVVSELQALREDMEYMTEEMTNMQIVMDTGALVGSTVGAYDDALGRRAVYGERGN